MLVTINKCPRCEDVHFDLQVYKLRYKTMQYYYTKYPKTNKFFSIIQKEVN